MHPMNRQPTAIQACPRCGDIAHQRFVGAYTDNVVLLETWNCDNPAGTANAFADGCGSHSHEFSLAEVYSGK